MVAYEMSRTELKFTSATTRDYLDYFRRTGLLRPLNHGHPPGVWINNKAGLDTCEDRFGPGRCPRE
jgi:hypothetical protein